MAVSKKIRFEVFKRDGFRCAYCGKSPPEVILEIDHIKPKSKKGKDDINNLITACFDCNRGKSNIVLDKAPQQLIDNIEVLKEKEEQLVEYHKLIRRIERRIQRHISEIDNIFIEYFKKLCLSEGFKRGSLKQFLNKLSLPEVKDAMHIACSRKPKDQDGAIRYFCGVCWNKIRQKSGEKIPLSKQILKMWKRLTQEYNKGIGYYSEEDLKWLEDVYSEDDVEFLEECMRFSFARLSNGPYGSYWKNFIWFAQDNNLQEAKECHKDE